MTETGLYIVWFFWTIALLILYHKVIAVYYFDLLNGLLKELVVSALLGGIMTGLTLMYWYVAAIIIIIIGLSARGKVGNKALVAALVLAVFVAIMGIKLHNSSSREDAEDEVEMDTFADVDPDTYSNYEDIDTITDSDYEDIGTAGAKYDYDVDTTADVEYEKEETIADGYDDYNDYYFPENDVNGQYIFAESNVRLLDDSELEECSPEILCLARNEIYARHGRRFNDEAIQEYFNSMPWYEGTVEPEDFDDGVFNQYEKANLEKILMYE